MPKSPTSNLNAPRNARKAAENLWGLCQGLAADAQLNDDEILFLQIWLEDNAELSNNPDAVDLLECASDIVKAGHCSVDTREDLKQLVSDIVEYQVTRADQEATANMNMLLGILQGLMADEELNDKEIRTLHEWMEENPYWRHEWPGDVIYKRLKDVLSDGIITDTERQSLIDVIGQATNTALHTTGSSEAMTITIGTEEPDTVDFEGKTFCLTGTFLLGPRKHCESEITTRKGKNGARITQGTDYLVLGTRVSPDWIHTSFGRKIEQARRLQSEGHPIKIISEECWTRYL